MKSLKIYLIAAGVVLIIYIVAMLNRPKDVDWSETLSNTDKIPFGTYILNHRLNDIFPNAKITMYRQAIYNVIAEDSIRQSSYLIVCQGIEPSKADYDQLIAYMKKGNNVFIAADYFGRLFEKNLDITTQYNFTFQKQDSPVSLVDPALKPHQGFIFDKRIGNNYFSKIDTSKAAVIGENNDHKANFVKYNFGSGNLYLLCNPKVFSNYNLLNAKGRDYAQTVLSFLKNTPRLVVDEYYTQGNGEEESPMRVFLRNPVLQWAYYIAMFSLLAFVLFELKRRQRIIPVIEPLQNSTLDFVTVVGQVYYEHRDNANIAQKKITYLLSWLRDQYQLQTAALDDEFIEKLSAKLNIELSVVRELVDYIRYINVQQKVTDRELIQLNKLIEDFYIKAR